MNGPPALVPIRYVKVRVERRSRYLMLTRDDTQWLGGYEVGKDGGRIVEDADGVDVDRVHLIQRAAISAGEVTVIPMRMNLTFATLEPARRSRRRRR